MARDAKIDCTGDLEIMIRCPAPGCDFYGIVYYRTQPPSYCSDACKQKAYRLRKMRNSQRVTHLYRQWEEQGLSAYRSQLDVILVTWGADAAEAAAKLALGVAREIRETTRRY